VHIDQDFDPTDPEPFQARKKARLEELQSRPIPLPSVSPSEHGSKMAVPAHRKRVLLALDVGLHVVVVAQDFDPTDPEPFQARKKARLEELQSRPIPLPPPKLYHETRTFSQYRPPSTGRRWPCLLTGSGYCSLWM
jgi:muconolactone delta-isomerase